MGVGGCRRCQEAAGGHQQPPEAAAGRICAWSAAARLVKVSPALIVQGDDDPIVARSSTDRIARSLRASGAPAAYHRYPGRGHFDLIAAAHTGIAQWIDTQMAETPPASRRPRGLGTDPTAFPSDTVPRPGHHRYTATGTLCPHHSRRRPCRAGRLERRSPSCPCPPPLTPSSWNSAPTVTSPGGGPSSSGCWHRHPITHIYVGDRNDQHLREPRQPGEIPGHESLPCWWPSSY